MPPITPYPSTFLKIDTPVSFNVTNLLSNAFKFTPEKGKVTLSIRIADGNTIKKPGNLEITVRDSGRGIPAEYLDKIFDRFYQVDESCTSRTTGTGIGLSLTKELISLQYGKIKVESRENQGSKFTVSLPLGKEHLK